MGEQIAVALLTCVDTGQPARFAYTERTIATFLHHNPVRDRFILLHGDDASSDVRVPVLANACGFETVHQTQRRAGWREARLGLIRHAARVAPWVLLLENDIETLRPFPWALFDFVATSPKVDCLRLYGRFKSSGSTYPCLTVHKKTRLAVRWKPVKGAPEPAESSVIHWSAQPCATRSPVILQHHVKGTEPSGRTVRVTENVTSHIGVKRTRGWSK